MRKEFRIFSKVKSIVALLVVFLLVLATNLMDNRHFETVKESITTVYEDRLVAKTILYRISKKIQIKRLAFSTGDPDLIFKTINSTSDSIKVLLNQFAETKLTSRESQEFGKLKSNLIELQNLEHTFISGSILIQEAGQNQIIENSFLEIERNLDSLYEIQLKEGKRQMNISSRAVDTSNLISRMEIIFLILIGIAIQVLILYTPKPKIENH